MAINMFGAHEGRRLSPWQRFIYRLVNVWIPTALYWGVIAGILYVIGHSLIKYW